DRVTALAISPDGKILASISTDACRQWDIEQGTELRSLGGVDSNSLAFNVDSKLLAAAKINGGPSAWLWLPGAEPRELPMPNGSGNAVVFTPNGKILAYSTSEGFGIKLWDVAKAFELRTLLGHESVIYT